jgi:aspartokinase-like uncharacterized kinase
VVKVGGSLGQRPQALRRLMTTLARLGRTRRLVVVGGGGRFADEVRRADRRFDLTGSASHWMAILAMDQFAHLIGDLARGAVVVREASELRPRRLNVLAPSTWLRRADPLPHSWEVTSDSIAAWVARTLHARRLVLLKSVDGRAMGVPVPHPARARPPLARRARASQLGDLVDPYFARALGAGMPCWIVSGTHPERLAALFRSGSTRGTELISDGVGAPPRARSRPTLRPARPRARD